MDISLPFQSLSIEETAQHLNTTGQGLQEEEVKKRREAFGRNVLKEEKISKIRIFFRQFNSVLVYILVCASLISLFLGEYRDFAVIIGIILLNGGIAFWQELKAETSLAALKKLTEIQSKVIRNGHLIALPSIELVPGDVLVFHEGEAVTADIRLIESHGLMVDESALTGESIPVLKDHTHILPSEALPYELSNMLLSGTMITRGTGKGIVARTGTHTYLSNIAEKAQEASPDTPLTLSLRRFVKGYILFLIALFTSLGIIGFFQNRPLLELTYILLASLVSAVPEGLPIVLTLVLVVGALTLSRKKVLVRYLPAVETMGSATVIASDKTGTITQGKLRIAEVYSQEEQKLKRIAALCNDSHEGSGDPIDVALAQWADDFEPIRRQFPRLWSYAFDTRLRFMASAHEIEGHKKLLVKGAFEALKEKADCCDPEMEKAVVSFLEQGLRVLAFGEGDWNGKDPSAWHMQLIGVIGFIDPPKEGVQEAVLSAKRAGIRVAMITGDHPQTAKAVAQEVRIWEEGDRVLTGKEMDAFPENELLEAIQRTTVFARILPEHKYKIVKLLQKDREIVAVTGDGVNDVPALKAANIGVGMGSGTEAAKSVSKMIITDSNLKIIVDAIQNARIIADNMRKVIYYLMSTSLQELIVISLSISFSLQIPLSAIQILWINIVTDGVQDKFFAFAKEEGDVMSRKPREAGKLFFDLKQIFRIAIFGIPVGISVFLLYCFLLGKYTFETISSVIFTSTVLAQWANGVQAQKGNEPFFKNIRYSFAINPLIYLGLGVGGILQFIAIYLFPEFFHSTRIPIELWKFPLLVFFVSFAIVEVRKWCEQCIKRT